MTARRLVAIFLAGGLLGASVGFAKEAPAEISPAQREFFEDEIRPLFIEHCYECHDASDGDFKGGLALESPAGLREGGDTGPAVAPGHPEKSLLIRAIGYADRDLQMPPRSPLPDEAVRNLEKWVAMGAPDPRDEPAAGKPEPSGMSPEEGREFWSFETPTAPTPPEVDGLPADANPIDRFVRARLAEKGLSPAPRASKQRWLRRATFDLTGLPPTPEEIDAFLEDDSPEAWSRVVDRLLDSPAYGVRWGRHWLDVARYADSNGLDENLAFGNAWRYRDYVVEAFNEDKPFDRFLIEQIAGDLLPEPTRETRTATGFLALGARVLAEKDREKLEMDVIDEQLDTTGKAFLGLTLGCARCHDHKFDPILQSDYYSLAAIFRNSLNFADSKTGSIRHWYEHDFATDAEEKKLKKWDERISQAKKKARKLESDARVELRGVARARAVDYLVAALEFGPRDSLARVREIAEPLDLHPRILYHCRRHLEVHRDSKVFGPWWKFREQDDPAGLRAHYDERFGRAVLAFSKLQEENPKAKTLDDPELEPFRAALFDKSGFLALPAKPGHALDEETLAELEKLEEEARLLESRAPDRPGAMGIADAEEIDDTLPIHIRGSHLNLGDPVPRAAPAVFGEDLDFPADTSGRLKLARWMADPEHPLTARVIVNRVWRWHFGRGLVGTTENFGVLGKRPTHPELLDWLAVRLVESGWSIKDLHRLIMSSETYRQSHRLVSPSGADPSGADPSGADPSGAESDPENRWLAHFPVRRLEAEAIRDAILAVSGRLDRERGGKTIPLRNRQMVFNHTSEDHTTYESTRRSAYLPIVRNHLYDWLQLFDYPDPTTPTGDRQTTIIAPQALLMMNSPLALDSADAFAARLARTDLERPARVVRAWRLAYGRAPTPTEKEASLAFLERESRADENGGDDAWSLFCQSLFASNEFLYLN